MALIIDINVVPSAAKARWRYEPGKGLKCYLTSAPERNRANDELVKRLAAALSIPQRAVTIIAGATARTKRVQIAGDFTLDQLVLAVGCEVQKSIFDKK
jgi:uncharacterized protein YggU (UPF0235/DUF167 family)